MCKSPKQTGSPLISWALLIAVFIGVADAISEVLKAIAYLAALAGTAYAIGAVIVWVVRQLRR